MRHLSLSHRRLNHRRLAEPSRRYVSVHVHVVPSPHDEVLPSPPLPTLGGGLPSCTVNTKQTVRRCYRPRCCHGRRHQPRAPNPSCDEALPSHPHPTLGGTSTPTIITYPVGTRDVPSSLGVVIDLTFLDDVFFSLQPAL
jgi:hypothetical protein